MAIVADRDGVNDDIAFLQSRNNPRPIAVEIFTVGKDDDRPTSLVFFVVKHIDRLFKRSAETGSAGRHRSGSEFVDRLDRRVNIFGERARRFASTRERDHRSAIAAARF